MGNLYLMTYFPILILIFPHKCPNSKKLSGRTNTPPPGKSWLNVNIGLGNDSEFQYVQSARSSGPVLLSMHVEDDVLHDNHLSGYQNLGKIMQRKINELYYSSTSVTFA